MLPVNQMLLTNHNRPEKKLIKLKGVVIHWTANTNARADAKANRNYFNTTKKFGSAHYIVDDKQIIQCVPDNEVAYHVGANKYTAIGQKIREGKLSPNYFLIGIEMCVNRDGNWGVTYNNTAELTAYLLKKYNKSLTDLYRHFDITGKDCPKMMVPQVAWDKFKADVKRAIGIADTPTKVLKYGMQCEEVKTLQNMLNKLGYKLIVDGHFGIITKGAVTDYQRTNGLVVDGIVGPKTWKKLFE